MHISTQSKIRKASVKPYVNWLKLELNITKTKVKLWMDWKPDNLYEAFPDNRRVVIPIPECDWSFLVALHEIGHISTGERTHTYLSEYNAERWAIARAKESYGIYSQDYVDDAKEYVKLHLINNLMYSRLKIDKVKAYVLDWLGTTAANINSEINN